jgi:hypothetical protein
MCNKNLLPPVPVFLSQNNFNVENCRSKTYGSEARKFKPEFISYTKGVTFELQLGDNFETKIDEILIGVPNPPIKSNSKLKYNGWILPHSSISGIWRRRV